jgi:dethiobiotin synthetase
VVRPELVVGVTGTGTGVGKTWVAAELSWYLRGRGDVVAARKPVQSFDSDDEPGSTDAEVLAGATGDEPEVVCPVHRWLAVPMAPPMAAAALGLPPFTVAALAQEITWPHGVTVGLVEGAGGVRAPIADDGDNAALFDLLRPDLVVVVADAGLGTINMTRLTVEALTGHDVVVHLNRFDSAADLHALNRAWLTGRDGLAITTSVIELGNVIEGRLAG